MRGVEITMGGCEFSLFSSSPFFLCLFLLFPFLAVRGYKLIFRTPSQGGSNSDNVLADAYVKGLSAPEYGINWTGAYLAMKTNAELVPYNTFDFGDPTGSVKEGRGALPDWTNVDANAGYTPDGYGENQTIMHCYDHFADWRSNWSQSPSREWNRCKSSLTNYKHGSLTGLQGAPTYGFIHQMPLSTLENVNVLDNLTYMQERTELDIASVGYYKTSLANGVIAELSATAHAGIVQYNFTSGSERHILVDVSHMLPSSGEAQHSQFYANGFLARSPDGMTYEGYGVYRGGFSSRGSQSHLPDPPQSAKLLSLKTDLPQAPMPPSTSAPNSTPLPFRPNSSPAKTPTPTGPTALSPPSIPQLSQTQPP